MNLPEGVDLTAFKMHRDERGWLTEIFRDEWQLADPCQWNITRTNPGVLRGLHVHHRHHDYLVVMHGRITVGLRDLRPKSPTCGASAVFEMSDEKLAALRIPPGVLHGFYCPELTLYTYGVDAYYDPGDELGCHWADPAAGIAWPCRDPILSARDRDAGSLAELESRLRAIDPAFA